MPSRFVCRAPGATAAMVFAIATGGHAAAQAPQPFTEESILRGIEYSYAGDAGWQTFGRGVALVDLDDDGDADLVALAGNNGLVGLYENLGGGFVDRVGAAGLPPWGDASSVIAADYDGDGDLDLYIGRWLSENILLRNDGGFTFTDVTTAAGVGDEGAAAGCAWGDYDGDGWLDLYLSNRTQTEDSTVPNRLYRNLGDGTFAEVATDMGVDDGLSPTFQAVFFDMDRDRDADLYLSTDKGYGLGEQNRLFENVAGVLIDITQASNTAAEIDSMGVAVGDFDRNGLPDLYCTNTPTAPGNVLLLNQGDGVFYQPPPAECGTASNATGWGTAFLDYDGDGWLELYVCNVFNGANRLYEHDGSWPAVDVAVPLGVENQNGSYGLAVADIDTDGDLDLLVQDTDRLRLFVNHEGELHHWIRLDVRAPAPNCFAVGAVADIRTGTFWQSREVAIGRSYKSQHELPLHFGTADAAIVDEIVVAFPDGATRTLTGYPADETWTVHHPVLLFDADGDGGVDLDDLAAFAACLGPVSTGCTIMDGDGDGVIGAGDVDGLLAAYAGPIHDCDDSGVADLAEILTGALADTNANWIPDDCEATGDVDGDGDVDVDDLLVVILGWGPCPVDQACHGDAEMNGVVDVDDLVTVLLGWTGTG